jgi:hypothetical protein
MKDEFLRRQEQTAKQVQERNKEAARTMKKKGLLPAQPAAKTVKSRS